MDNATYDELHLTPVNDDDTYSRLRTTPTNKQSYELKRGADGDKSATKEIQMNNTNHNIKFNTVMIIMMMILLLISVLSIALSVTTFVCGASQQTEIVSKVENTSATTESAIASQLDTIQMNIFQRVMKLVEMQLAAAQLNISRNIVDLVKTQFNLAHGNISKNISQLDAKFESSRSSISFLKQYLNVHTQMACGPGLWHRLIYLNMSDPSQQCPSAWRKYSESEVRACGRPDNSLHGSCASVQNITYQQYSRVCGRIIGYQFASPDAFERNSPNGSHINLDGINITYGANRNHIWSYVAGIDQNASSQSMAKCPCSTGSRRATGPPPSIGSNYYCESGNPDSHFMHKLYSEDPLWDGQQCEGTCCTGTNSPPWFSVQLPAPTTDAIEVSICCDQGTNDEDVPVELVEIYVQ